jgi:hypothetical protein
MFTNLCRNSSLTKWQTFPMLCTFGLLNDVIIARSTNNKTSKDNEQFNWRMERKWNFDYGQGQIYFVFHRGLCDSPSLLSFGFWRGLKRPGLEVNDSTPSVAELYLLNLYFHGVTLKQMGDFYVNNINTLAFFLTKYFHRSFVVDLSQFAYTLAALRTRASDHQLVTYTNASSFENLKIQFSIYFWYSYASREFWPITGASSDAAIIGASPTYGSDVCVCVFLLCLCCFLCR